MSELQSSIFCVSIKSVKIIIFTVNVLYVLSTVTLSADAATVEVVSKKHVEKMIKQYKSFKKALDTLKETIPATVHERLMLDRQIQQCSTFCSALTSSIPAVNFDNLEEKPKEHKEKDLLAESLIRSYMQERARSAYASCWKEFAYLDAHEDLTEVLKEKEEGLASEEEDPSTLVYVQNFIIDLLLNMVVTSGQQYASMLFNQQEQQEDAQLNQKIKDLQTQFKATQSSLAQQTEQTLKTIESEFSSQLDTIQKTTTAAQQEFLKEVQYVQRLVNLNVPSQQFLTDFTSRTSLDVLFGSSTMLTPNNGTTWYNIFGRSYPTQQDWEFDPDLQAFAQRGPLGAQPSSVINNLSQQWLDDQSKVNSAVAEFNQIFTEYYTTQSSYTIKIQVTLINCSYPFFAGILFNKARWLSGSPDRMYSYRLVGLYGTKSGKTPRIGFYGGQTISTNVGGLTIPTTTLNAITTGTNLPLYTLPSTVTSLVGKDPVTFIITLAVQESTVTAVLDLVNSDNSTKTLFSSPLAELDSQESQLLFWYHGIGFMAPGCQALFKIIQPTELTYTSDQITAFKKQVAQAAQQTI